MKNNKSPKLQDKINIRREQAADYKKVEEINRKAFWNLYVPGCYEHYLVHVMRQHKDFIQDLALVLEIDEQIVGNIMYTKARLVDECGQEKTILTFGPLCIAPEYQRMGYGKMLMAHSFEQAVALGYDVVVIFGDPGNYASSGFISCRKHNISLENGSYPAAMMVKELAANALDGRKLVYYDSPAMHIDLQAAEDFDNTLEKMEKKYQPSQEAFYIYSHSMIMDD